MAAKTRRFMSIPAIVAFIGALISAIGAIWASRDQDTESKENKQLYKQIAEQNEEIANYAKKQERASEENAKLNQQIAEQSSKIAAYAEKQARASEKVSELQQQLLEKANAQIQRSEEIAQLNKDLAKPQSEIAKLSQDVSNYVTGGDSFCYIDMYPTTNGKIRVQAFHMGIYPLRIDKILVFNRSEAYRRGDGSGAYLKGIRRSWRYNSIAFENVNLVRSPIDKFIGEIDKKAEWRDNDLYHIEFHATNGTWEQDLHRTSEKVSIVVTKEGKTIFER